MPVNPPLKGTPYTARKPWRGWTRRPTLVLPDGGTIEVWENLRYRVCSSVHLVEFRGRMRWQYQISVSVLPRAQVSRKTHALIALAAAMGAPLDSGDGRKLLSPRFDEGERRERDDDSIARVLKDFDMVGAEEDNHENGRARHFWRMCEREPGEVVGECECKETEEIVVEPDGHTWSRTRPT